MANGNLPTFSSSAFSKSGPHTFSIHYVNREAIFSQGDVADAVFRVEEGNVKLSVKSDHGRKAAIAVLRAGECFGEGCIVGSALRTFTATSIQDSKIGRISKRAVVRRLHQDPAFAKLFIAHLLGRIDRVEDDLVDQLVNTSEKRLARLLLQLSGGKHSRRSMVAIHVDQGTLAQVVGTTRSRVSHFMNRFRRMGLIDYNGTLHVHKALIDFLLKKPKAN